MDFKALLKPYEKQMMETLKEFLSINSFYDETTKEKGKPFGEGVYRALQFVANFGRKNGFEVDTCDGYATELIIGNGPLTIGIYAHTDVVPISGKWDNPPFEPVIKDGNIYARGSSDDKGPLVAALYSVIALRDKNLLDGVKIRFVCGGDEERGSSCLEYYFDVLKKPYPDYGFTPDSDFPLIYGEKGITNFYPYLKVKSDDVISIEGGVATNAVCDEVKVVVKDVDPLVKYLTEKKVNFELDGNAIIFKGASAHGSTPDAGINAALIALKNLGDFYKIEKFSLLGEKLLDGSGRSFNGFASTELLGETTYCLGLISYKDNELNFSINFRYPNGVNPNEFRDHFDEYFGSKSPIDEPSPLVLFEPTSKLVSTLYKAYQEESGDHVSPMLTTGGGTYAKHAKNTIAFGALFPGRVSTMHEPNEYMPVEDFYLSSVIYARAIFDLGKLK